MGHACRDDLLPTFGVAAYSVVSFPVAAPFPILLVEPSNSQELKKFGLLRLQVEVAVDVMGLVK